MEESEFAFHNGLWVHVAPSGFVRYFAHSGLNRDEGGYCGATFKFLHNGQPRSVKGPWSSRAGCVNEAGYNVVDVTLRDPKGGSYSACITYALLMQLLDEQQPDFCVVLNTTGEPVYYPSIMPDCVMKPNRREVDNRHEFQTVWEPGLND
jgi:hypothetical protein